MIHLNPSPGRRAKLNEAQQEGIVFFRRKKRGQPEQPAPVRPAPEPSGPAPKEVSMSYKTILVHVDGTPASKPRLDTAIELARKQEAHVTAVAFAVENVPLVTAGAAYPIPRSQEAWERIKAEADAARDQAESELRKEGLAYDVRTIAAMVGDVSSLMALSSLYADLVILGVPHRSSFPTYHLLNGALFGAPVPVLLMPEGGPALEFGGQVTLAWDGKREAGAAARLAMPFFEHAEKVNVLAVRHAMGGEPFGDDPGVDCAGWLARHGVTTELRQKAGSPVSDVILQDLQETGSKLLVMGGYGHARWRESLFGGVTENLLSKGDTPLLLAH